MAAQLGLAEQIGGLWYEKGTDKRYIPKEHGFSETDYLGLGEQQFAYDEGVYGGVAGIESETNKAITGSIGSLVSGKYLFIKSINCSDSSFLLFLFEDNSSVMVSILVVLSLTVSSNVSFSSIKFRSCVSDSEIFVFI